MSETFHFNLYFVYYTIVLYSLYLLYESFCISTKMVPDIEFFYFNVIYVLGWYLSYIYESFLLMTICVQAYLILGVYIIDGINLVY